MGWRALAGGGVVRVRKKVFLSCERSFRCARSLE